MNFVGVTEHDYEWLTGQIGELANRYGKEAVLGIAGGDWR